MRAFVLAILINGLASKRSHHSKRHVTQGHSLKGQKNATATGARKNMIDISGAVESHSAFVKAHTHHETPVRKATANERPKEVFYFDTDNDFGEQQSTRSNVPMGAMVISNREYLPLAGPGDVTDEYAGNSMGPQFSQLLDNVGPKFEAYDNNAVSDLEGMRGGFMTKGFMGTNEVSGLVGRGTQEEFVNGEEGGEEVGRKY